MNPDATPAPAQVHASPIRAAGGLVWRRAGAGYELAVIRRVRYGDWTLPKGKLEPGEGWSEAALREVEEETGYRATLGGFAGAVTYSVGDRPKVVLFWHMLVAPNAVPGPLPELEVERVVWLTAFDARDRLDHPIEQALLEVWISPETPSLDSSQPAG